MLQAQNECEVRPLHGTIWQARDDLHDLSAPVRLYAVQPSRLTAAGPMRLARFDSE